MVVLVVADICLLGWLSVQLPYHKPLRGQLLSRKASIQRGGHGVDRRPDSGDGAAAFRAGARQAALLSIERQGRRRPVDGAASTIRKRMTKA